MARLQFATVGSDDYQRLLVWEFLDRLDRHDLNPEMLSDFEFKVKGSLRLLTTCPYCNAPHDLGSLCSHLIQNHLFESRPAVCPGCDMNQTRMLYHIVEAHRFMLRIKKRSFLQLPPIDPSATNEISQHSQLFSELMSASRQTPRIRNETSLQTFLDRSATHLQSSVPVENMLINNISDVLDDFVSSSNAEDTLTLSASKEEESKENEESDASLTPEEREQKQKRAEFVRELVMSSIFDD